MQPSGHPRAGEPASIAINVAAWVHGGGGYMIQRMQRSGGAHRSQQEPGCSPQRQQARAVLWRQHLRQQHEVAALTLSVPPRKIDETQQRLCIAVIRKTHVGGPLHSLVNLDCAPLSGVIRAQVGHGSSCQRVGGRFGKEALDAAVDAQVTAVLGIANLPAALSNL